MAQLKLSGEDKLQILDLLDPRKIGRKLTSAPDETSRRKILFEVREAVAFAVKETTQSDCDHEISAYLAENREALAAVLRKAANGMLIADIGEEILEMTPEKVFHPLPVELIGRQLEREILGFLAMSQMDGRKGNVEILTRQFGINPSQILHFLQQYGYIVFAHEDTVQLTEKGQKLFKHLRY